ncbi:MAG: hypothetical protein OCC49_10530 [Fibrobacterales bacterium]
MTQNKEYTKHGIGITIVILLLIVTTYQSISALIDGFPLVFGTGFQDLELSKNCLSQLNQYFGVALLSLFISSILAPLALFLIFARSSKTKKVVISLFGFNFASTVILALIEPSSNCFNSDNLINASDLQQTFALLAFAIIYFKVSQNAKDLFENKDAT